MNKEPITVVELTPTHLKLVQSKDSPDGRVLTQIVFRPLTSDSQDVAIKTLQEACSILKSHPRLITCVLPRNEVTVRMLRLPSQEDLEIADMVNLQIAKLTPFSPEDVVFDYMLIGSDKDGFTQVVIVIVHKKVVERYVNIFKAAKIGLSHLVLSSQGLCNLYLYYQNKLGPSFDKETVIILDIDKTSTEISFYYKGNFIFSRALQISGDEIKEGRTDSLMEELRLTLGTYEKEGIGIPVKKIVLTNVVQGLERFSQRIESALSVPTEIINPQVELLKEKDVMMPLGWAEGEVSANTLLGWALQKPEKALNLLPHKLLDEHKEKARNKDVAVLLVLSLIIMLLLVLSLAIKVYKKNHILKTMVRLTEQSGLQAKEAEKELKKLELIKTRLLSSVFPVDVIYELYEMLPTGVALRLIDMDKSGNISLQGTAMSMAEVFNLQSNLEKSAHFSNVEVKFASKRNSNLGEVTDFKIDCQIEGKQK